MESFLLCKLENYRLLDLSLIMLYIHLLHALLVLPADTNLQKVGGGGGLLKSGGARAPLPWLYLCHWDLMIWLSETNAVKLTMTGGDSLLAAVATAATAATASCLTLGGGARVVQVQILLPVLAKLEVLL